MIVYFRAGCIEGREGLRGSECGLSVLTSSLGEQEFRTQHNKRKNSPDGARTGAFPSRTCTFIEVMKCCLSARECTLNLLQQ